MKPNADYKYWYEDSELNHLKEEDLGMQYWRTEMKLETAITNGDLQKTNEMKDRLKNIEMLINQ